MRAQREDTTLRAIVRAARALVARHRAVPAGVLFLQLFLGLGWLRAAAAHGLSPSWWSGGEVLGFLLETEQRRLPFYDPLVDLVIRPFPDLLSIGVWAIQVSVGIGLVLGLRPILWVLVGMFLNVNFILAGEVNPSVFYLVMATPVLLWVVGGRLDADSARRLSRWALLVGVAVVAVCLPFVSTVDPDHVVEDPALVLITLALLFAFSTWSLRWRPKTATDGDSPSELHPALDPHLVMVPQLAPVVDRTSRRLQDRAG